MSEKAQKDRLEALRRFIRLAVCGFAAIHLCTADLNVRSGRIHTSALLLLQVATAFPSSEPTQPFTAEPIARCDASSSEEIVVCGRERQHRLQPLRRSDFDFRPVRAEFRVGKGKAAIIAEQQTFGNAASNRVMLKFKLPF